ncbi:hypothetical protein PRZ48_012796 [Zasmidium cellare]|uniref:BTB domain-containing protein n=1 Tax=Zasmidium cellare TaxID=395010 RepID=A0ABR0E5W4_ZASCE|nr:hypothetical protein PRZ48_012796 [Zasmidium cellare]
MSADLIEEGAIHAKLEKISIANGTTKPAQEETSNTVTIDPRGDLTLRTGCSGKSLLVCSRTLLRISPVFQRMLYGFFGESTTNNSSQWTVNLPEDEPVAFELFLYIAHGFTQKVPHELPIDSLFNLTKLTHHYDATLLLKPWVPQWISSLREPKADDEIGMYKMLWIDLELGQRRSFGLTARRIVMESSSLYTTEDLIGELEVFPDLIERVQRIREQTFLAMLDLIRNLTEILTTVDKKPRWCKHASYMGPHRCESMILGSIVFCMTRAGLWPIPDIENLQESVVGLYRSLMNLVIHDIGQPEKKGDDHHACNPKQFLTERLQRILAEMADPVLETNRKQLDTQARKLCSTS